MNVHPKVKEMCVEIQETEKVYREKEKLEEPGNLITPDHIEMVNKLVGEIGISGIMWVLSMDWSKENPTNWPHNFRVLARYFFQLDI